MKTRKLTMLSIHKNMGQYEGTVFLWVDYIDGKLDFHSAYKEVERVMPHCWPRLSDYLNGVPEWLQNTSWKY